MALVATLVLVLLVPAAYAAPVDVTPPLLTGNEFPLPLDALVEDTPDGPLPFPSPFSSSNSRPLGPPHMPPLHQHGVFFSLFGPHPPPGPRPHPGPPHPPPPEVLELVFKLLGAAGSGLEAFYANKSSSTRTYVSFIDTSPQTCGYCVGNETKKLLTAVQESITAVCADAVRVAASANADSAPQEPNLEPLKNFCEVYPRLQILTVLALLDKMGISPLSTASARCAAAGPCSFHPKAPLASSASYILSVLDQVDVSVEEDVKAEADVGADEEGSDGSFMDLMGVDEQADLDPCHECIVSGFELVKEVVHVKFKWVCTNAQCPRIKAMCKFAKEHPYLTMVGVVLKIKPWKKVVPGCFIVGACKPPSPPGPPPHGAVPPVGAHPLPIFPALDLDPFAPPPPPPVGPGGCLMGFVHRVASFFFSPAPVAKPGALRAEVV